MTNEKGTYNNFKCGQSENNYYEKSLKIWQDKNKISWMISF